MKEAVVSARFCKAELVFLLLVGLRADLGAGFQLPCGGLPSSSHRQSCSLGLGDVSMKTSASPEAAALIKAAWDKDVDIKACKLPLKRREVAYTDGDQELKGLVVWPDMAEDSKTKLPGIIVVHAAVGLQEDFMYWKLESFASLGYVAFGADYFGKGRALWDRSEIMEVRKPLAEDRSRMAQRGVAAYKALQGLEMVQPDSIAAAGFCFGGMAVLDLARSGLAPDLRATITYHGILDSPDLGSRSDGQVNGKLLVFHGDKDPFIPPDKFREFEEDLKRREADYKIVRFANGMHAFTRPEKVLEADRESGFQYELDWHQELMPGSPC